MTIDTTATEPPRNWFLDIASAPTEDLLREATGLRAKLAIAQQQGHRVDARAYELRLLDVERAIAIHNRRATEAEDQRAPAGIAQMDVDALLATLRVLDQPEAHAVVMDMWTALQTMQAQREADLREAFVAGAAWRAERLADASGAIQDENPAAAAYARGKDALSNGVTIP